MDEGRLVSDGKVDVTKLDPIAFDSVNRAYFSNAKVKKCARLCDSCDMRFYCRYK